MAAYAPGGFKLKSSTILQPRFSTVTTVEGLSGGITYSGSPTTLENLTLRPNSADILTGNVEIAGGHITWLSGNPSISTANGPSLPSISILPDGGTWNFTTSGGIFGSTLSALGVGSTITWGAVGSSLPGPSVLNAISLFVHSATHRNVAGAALTWQGASRVLFDAASYQAFGNTVTMNEHTTVYSNLGSSVDSSASSAISGGTYTALRTDLTLTAASGRTNAATLYSPIKINAPTGSGAGTNTLTNFRGIDIADSTFATTNTGIRNASATVFTPKVKTITATTDSISVAATNANTGIRLNNTSGGSITLASTPTITAGQDGQILFIENTSAQPVVFQRESALAGSKLRLGAATRTLNQYDTITLWYDGTNAYWVELAFVDNT